MRALLLCAAAGALALSACQRDPAPETTTDDAAEAMPADAAAAPAAAPSAPSSSSSAASAAGDAGVDTAGAAPANEGGMFSGPSETTRDAAKEKAEQTNLHPRT